MSRAEKLFRRKHRKDRINTQPGEPAYPDPIEGAAQRLGRPNCLVIYNKPGEVKMSGVLLELVKPEWDTCRDAEDMERLLQIGVIAWNLALLDPGKRRDHLKELIKDATLEVRQGMEMVLEPYIRRKEKIFPNLKRPMLNFEMIRLPGNKVHVNVLSGLP